MVAWQQSNMQIAVAAVASSKPATAAVAQEEETDTFDNDGPSCGSLLV